MKVSDLLENEIAGEPPTDKTAKPSITYRQLGDKSWVARAVTASGGVVVHTRKSRSDLEKVMKRYK